MIHALTGELAGFGPSQVYLAVGGLEYEIHVPLDVLDFLQKKEKGASLHLYIYHHFRENEQRLFGFLDLAQREFFGALLELRGLGPSLALSLLSHLKGEEFIELCASNDLSTLCRIPRVGKSTAESLVFEVKRQRKKWDKILQKERREGRAKDKDEEALLREQEMALQALLQLGYREREAEKALNEIHRQRQKEGKKEVMGAADWIRSALQLM